MGLKGSVFQTSSFLFKCPMPRFTPLKKRQSEVCPLPLAVWSDFPSSAGASGTSISSSASPSSLLFLCHLFLLCSCANQLSVRKVEWEPCLLLSMFGIWVFPILGDDVHSYFGRHHRTRTNERPLQDRVLCFFPWLSLFEVTVVGCTPLFTCFFQNFFN